MVLGICYVIDSGIVWISCYSYCVKVQWLFIEVVLQVSVNQCKGCCGWVELGICVCFYSEEDFNVCLVFIDLEIFCINLVVVILQMLYLCFGDIEVFFFIELLDGKVIKDGFIFLQELLVVNCEGQLILLGC